MAATTSESTASSEARPLRAAGRAAAWFGGLLLVCYAPVLGKLARQWIEDPDMGHGVFVPVVAGYMVWRRRRELAALNPAPNWWGLAVVVWGAVQLYVATLGAELFLARTAFLISLAGSVLLVGGTRALRLAAFPLFLLCFMIPIPAIIYNQITFPLQLLASRLAEEWLSLTGLPVLREGNILELPSRSLNVVEACSGVRSLLSLSFLSLVFASFFDKKVWMRPVLLAASVPIAVAANAGRVTITGLLGEWRPELAEGLFHDVSGWIIFLLALIMLTVFHGMVNAVYGWVYGRR
ncbi:MAG TPA: exosortase/archaeosortase family protein [Bryobacteraceae bacterium]|nr:exosortase/archaeosortase family protein [Bryobacteraceae bacterium]